MRPYQYMTLVAAVVGMFLISACGVGKLSQVKVEKQETVTIDVNYQANPAQYYNGISYGLRPEVRCNIPSGSIVNNSGVAAGSYSGKLPDFYIVRPDVDQYAADAVRRYSSTIGFSNSVSASTDRILAINIREFNVTPGIRTSATVVLDYEVLDPSRRIVMSRQTISARHQEEAPTYNRATTDLTVYSLATNGTFLGNMLNAAYIKALSEINWSAIADLLTVHDTAVAEPNRRVQGAGDTALENTIIRWYIVSSPQGADVSWRVVSSTPDVHNTNSTYLGTTPYETTESFDIRGLTLENSGNVQIEVTCEKPGYLPQRKRFNLRQAIDQREISAKFNLVKEDE